MKKIYKIDSRFYFILLLHYKNFFDAVSQERIEEFFESERQKYKVYKNEKFIDKRRIEKLLNTVGASVFKRQNIRYYTKAQEVFDLITSFNSIIKQYGQFPKLEKLIEDNLSEHQNSDKISIFEIFIEDNNFYRTYLIKEKKNILWFVKNRNKSSSKKGNA